MVDMTRLWTVDIKYAMEPAGIVFEEAYRYRIVPPDCDDMLAYGDDVLVPSYDHIWTW
jgi:hypothetical protein